MYIHIYFYILGELPGGSKGPMIGHIKKCLCSSSVVRHPHWYPWSHAMLADDYKQIRFLERSAPPSRTMHLEMCCINCQLTSPRVPRQDGRWNVVFEALGPPVYIYIYMYKYGYKKQSKTHIKAYKSIYVYTYIYICT